MEWIFGKRGRGGFGFRSTDAEVTDGIDGSALTAIVTGGASGIGEETAKMLALRGVHVIIAGRNLEAATSVKENICNEKNDARVDLLHLDLSSMSSVRKFADGFKSMKLPLNILINNAGVMLCPFQLSEDGVEMQFATNHLGHFLLTNLLLETMKESAKKSQIKGRIVILTSTYRCYTYKEGIRFDKISSAEGYTPLKAYGQSKFANLLHCYELAKRLKEDGAQVTVNAVHPGYIYTNLQRHIPVLIAVWRTIFYYSFKTIPQGAATSCYVALHADVNEVSGKYFSDCKEESLGQSGKDIKMAEDLWELSEKMVKT